MAVTMWARTRGERTVGELTCLSCKSPKIITTFSGTNIKKTKKQKPDAKNEQKIEVKLDLAVVGTAVRRSKIFLQVRVLL